MNRILFSLVLFVVFSLTAFAQQSEVLLTVGNQEISKDEFEHIYQKNNSNLYSNEDKKSPEEYLDLFINFKLKVVEAEALKMDTSQAFITELAGYRKEVAAPYLTDIDYSEHQVEELYRRMTLEVDASHILLRVDANASEQKKKEVLDKIRAIRNEIVAGKSFEEAAIEYSEDPSAKSNKGRLGYFSAFTMVVPFEDAAFNTPVGEISDPVKTDFGYHIIKVHDVRQNKGEILVAHIMKNIPREAPAVEKIKAKAAIDSIYQLLLDGADFAEMAKNESQDRRSAVRGGEMPWFAAGRIVAEFSDPAFTLKNNGDFTQPVETPFGYHIIKRLNARPVPPFEEARATIESQIKKDPIRLESGKKVFIEKLKTAYNFQEDEAAKAQLADIQITESNDLPATTLFTIDNQEFGPKELEAFVADNKIKSGTYLSVYDRWVSDEITNLEDSKLEEKYPEFRYLMNEYHDGILLFNISQEKIWKYASQDTTGLEKFYEKDKNKHMWGDRFKGYLISCNDVSVREEAEDLFGAGMNADEVLAHINNNGEELISIESGAWEEAQNPIVDYYVWNGKDPDNFDSATTFIRGDKIDPEPKTLDEARGLFISDYQNYLEEQWLKELRSKHKVKVNKKLLKTIEGA
ncbi:peptidylprolyl isomerase [Draconibacterium sp. IB214405]|uniref:foldase protein PrsA n=1 Tax=Draconibacterium sp. IB214405 TaxID=3097352 RepID=UPI002A17FC62|nr:peptidylprolyl isomerase [Draconibacterium sp. IB214405]MDX8340385.1 peptidylprolyl isomerase [Draconibacterium sp. IB214405]